MRKFFTGALILLVLGASTIASAADVGEFYFVLKKKNFDQISSAAPALRASVPFQFGSFVDRDPGGSLKQGSRITPPGSGAVNLPQLYTVTASGALEYTSFFANQTNLNNAYGSGGYDLDLEGDQGSYSATLSLAGDSYPAAVPKISNTNFQNGRLVVNAAAPLTINWNSFSDRGPIDVILLSINSQSGTNLFRGVLPATSTAKAIGANFFKPEQDYVLELSFIRVTHNNTASISGSTGIAGYTTSTRIFISTSSLTPVTGLGNISTRGRVETGNNVLISGFIITGSPNSKLRVVVRAIGPSLAGAGVVGSLPDPILTLFDDQGQVIATNDEWATTAGVQQIRDVDLDPSNARESAILRDLAPGPYTAIVSGKNGTSGVGLAEVYNLGSPTDAKLTNISTRGQVRLNAEVMIGGLIVEGPFTKQVLLRALGPSLSSFGVPDVLQNPTMQLFDAQGSLIFANDNWKDSQQTQIQATNRAPTNDNESAILVNLVSGGYTAIVRGRSQTTGVGLVEAYQLN
jgi:hypothetical protein